MDSKIKCWLGIDEKIAYFNVSISPISMDRIVDVIFVERWKD